MTHNDNDKDRLDQWLDSALNVYGKAEPRAGLESRIVTNLAIERQRLAVRWGWGLVVASAAVTCGVLALWLGTFSHGPHSTNGVVAVRRAMQESNAIPVAPQAQRHFGTKLTIKGLPGRSGRARKMRTVDLASEPRLEQFPSARPLSEEEKLLKEFIRNSPQEAVLVAQVQAERQKELDRLMADQSSVSQPNQQER
jgi:hypothetical protein